MSIRFDTGDMTAPICRVLLASLVALGLSTASLRADPYVERKKRAGGTVVSLQLDSTTVALSGHIVLTVTVEGTAPLEVELSLPLTDPMKWEETALGEPETQPRQPVPGKPVTWRQAFKLVPLGPGEVPVKVASLKFREGPATPDNKWSVQAWEPIKVMVTTDVSAASLGEARDITPVEKGPEAPPEWTPWTMTTGVAVGAVAGVALVVWRLRRRPVRPLPELTPYQWSLRELLRIDALNLPADREIERYHTLVSDVLRRYLELRFNLHAPEQTTPEFLEALRHSSVLPAAQQEQLRDFLSRCDLAKFARADYSAEECYTVGRMAREFIEQTAQLMPPPPAAVNGQLVSKK
jgi:hypothetical protein